jgi:hypothetical protein
MNRSILIVICDFLLVSLVAFSNFDDDTLNRAEEKMTPTPGATSAAKESVAREMVSVLTTALNEERQSRQQLNTDLDRTRATAESQQAAMTEREQTIRQTQENLQRAEAEGRRIEEERTALLRQMEAARNNIESLQTALTATRSEATLSREQIQALQADLKKKQSESESLRKQVTDLENSRSNVLAVKQQLDTKLQVAEVETRLTKEHLTTVQSEVKAIRAEKAQIQATTEKLATGVTALAEKSGALTQEIRENRPLTANTIFAEFTRNRLDTRFESSRAGAFVQDVKREKNSQTILLSYGTNTFYALYHVLDTPLFLWPPGTEWHGLTGTISRGFFSFPVTQVAFLAEDPRVLVAPVDAAQVTKLGAKVYKIAPDPFRFQEAVLVGANDNYYGECKFQIDVTTPQYVKMDRSLFRGLIGKFNPSRGDLVLSKTGELLGIMVNNEYCAVLGKITPAVTLQCGDTLKAQRAGDQLTQLQNRVMQLPPKLQ